MLEIMSKEARQALKRSFISGTGVVIPGKDIDTDRIMPARFLKEITFKNMGNYLFYDERFGSEGQLLDHPLNDNRFKGASILVVGENFGCGSSREHAPQAILRSGFKAVVGVSFADIFSGNCRSLGIPTVAVDALLVDDIMRAVQGDPSLVLSVCIDTKKVTYGGTQVDCNLPEDRRQVFLSGTWNGTALLKANMGEVQQVAQRLPYMTGFL